MAEIRSVSKDAITGFNLSVLSFWRLALGVTLKDSIPCFSLIMRYPPGSDQHQVALARSTVPIAENHQEVMRVAKVATEGGTLDADTSRMVEAFNLFKNHDGLKGNSLETCITDAKKILEAYWGVRLWIEGNFKEDKEIKLELDSNVTTLYLTS